jgi:hypothetical protein
MKNTNFIVKLVAFFCALVVLAVGLGISIKVKEQVNIENELAQVNYAWIDSYGLAHVYLHGKKQNVFKGYAFSDISTSSKYIIGLTQDNKIVYSSLDALSKEKMLEMKNYGSSFSNLDVIDDNSFGFIATRGSNTEAVDSLIEFTPNSDTFTRITKNNSDVIQNWFGVSGKVVYKYGTSKNATVFDTKSKRTSVLPVSMSSELKGYFYLNKQVVIWGRSTNGFTKKTVGYSLDTDSIINLDKSLNGNGSTAEQILSYNNDFYWFTKRQIANTGIFDYGVSSSQTRLFSSVSLSFGGDGSISSSGNFIYVPVINGSQGHDVIVLLAKSGKQVSTIKNVNKIVLLK